MSVLQALLDAQLALLSHSNCLITDRPDLPRAPDTGWTTDFARELAAIDAAIFSLTGDLRKCPECGRCSGVNRLDRGVTLSDLVQNGLIRLASAWPLANLPASADLLIAKPILPAGCDSKLPAGPAADQSNGHGVD